MGEDFALVSKDLDNEEQQQIKNVYNDQYTSGCRRYGKKGYMLVGDCRSYLTNIRNMQLRSSDIFVTSFPRSGTTWMQELVWLIANDLDFDSADSKRLTERYAFLENEMFFSPDKISTLSKDSLQAIDILYLQTTKEIDLIPSPRSFKSHLPMSLLPSKLLEACKVVYMARDPRDVAVSYFHQIKFMKMCNEGITFKSFWELFIKDTVMWSPYFEHVKEAWRFRNHPNMLFMFYEDLSEDLPAAAHRVATFLGKKLNEKQVSRLCEYLKFDNFKNNTSVNLEDVKTLGFFDKHENFIRKGKIGEWQKYFDSDMKEQAERWMIYNLRDTDLQFPNFKHL